MHHLGDALAPDGVEQRIERPQREWVHAGDEPVVVGYLQQAEVRPVGSLTDELGVERDPVGGAESVYQFGECLFIGDE